MATVESQHPPPCSSAAGDSRLVSHIPVTTHFVLKTKRVYDKTVLEVRSPK